MKIFENAIKCYKNAIFWARALSGAGTSWPYPSLGSGSQGWSDVVGSCSDFLLILLPFFFQSFFRYVYGSIFARRLREYIKQHFV